MAVKIGLRLLGVFGEEVEKELQRFFALAAGGFKQAAHDAVILLQGSPIKAGGNDKKVVYPRFFFGFVGRL